MSGTAAELLQSWHIVLVPFNSAREQNSLQQRACQVTGSNTINLAVPIYQANTVDTLMGKTHGYMKMEAEIQCGFHKILLKVQTYSSGYQFW